MSELAWETVPDLQRPLVVVAFRGLFDAATSATAAIAWLRDRYPSERVAVIDPEQYFDFQQERPIVRIDDDGQRTLEWPTNDFYVVHTTATAGSADEHPRDLVVCGGVEPHLRWRSFCDHLLDIARTTHAEMVVTLGAMVGTNPHTRPFPVTGSAASPALAARLGLSSPTYQGPTGVVGTLHDTLDRAGVPVISLRVSVPHYVPAPPNPKATRALLKRFEDVTGVRTGFPRLDRSASEWEQRVDDAANEDDEVSTYVRKLERGYDEAEPLPSGEDIASELEAFLREQRDGD
jgi:proteasome assembly chaperone (PAC2) family protein